MAAQEGYPAFYRWPTTSPNTTKGKGHARTRTHALTTANSPDLTRTAKGPTDLGHARCDGPLVGITNQPPRTCHPTF